VFALVIRISPPSPHFQQAVSPVLPGAVCSSML
jgi:hypothetical protein